MKQMTNDEIELWIDNDEALYNWAYGYFKTNKNATIKSFIKENRAELVEYINNRINR